MRGIMKDWSEEWKKRRSEAGWKGQRKRKAYPDDYEELLNLSRYPGSILKRIYKIFKFQDECTVLDVGAGTGAFAIPLAKKVSAVTVVEPSKEMAQYLMKSADRNGLNNIEVITKRWEDISRDDLREYNVVLAARSYYMLDIKSALLKMLDVTKDILFLVSHVANYEFEDINKNFNDYAPAPDYIYLYNVLYQMKIYANVEIFTRDYDISYKSLLKQLVHLDMDSEKRVRDYLKNSNRLFKIKNNGELWVRCKYRDALIWYRKE
nr:putative SAM dependent methyltransferase [uncultured archaeon]